MEKVKRGIIYGIVFGALDILPMFGMEFPDKTAAILGAFINRFAIGLLIPLTQFPEKSLHRGLMLGLLLSLPDAIITQEYLPIMISGIFGGAIIGNIDDRINAKPVL